MKILNLMLDETIKKQFGSWTAFSNFLGKNPKNFKRTFLGLVEKLNTWLDPLGLELKVVRKTDQKDKKENDTSSESWVDIGLNAFGNRLD